MKFRQLLLFVVAFLGVTVPTTPGFSQQQSSSDAGGQIFKFAFSKMPYTASARSDLAKLYLAYCRDILAAIPTNTPAEEAWVAEEANTTQFDKINRLYHTKEFARSKLKETFSSCVSTASDLVLAQSTKDRDLEAAFFIKLAYLLNEDYDLQDHAKRLGKSVEQKLVLLSAYRRILMTAALRTLGGT